MSIFGSSLNIILEDMNKSSDNLYYCFNYKSNRYAVKALDICENRCLQGVYLNSERKPWLYLRGGTLPLTTVDGYFRSDDLIFGKQHILISRQTACEKFFGLLYDGLAELKIVKSIVIIDKDDKTYYNGIGLFEDEKVKIISINKLYDHFRNQLANTFERTEELFQDGLVEQKKINAINNIDKLNLFAYHLKLIVAEGSMEAVYGKKEMIGIMNILHEVEDIAENIYRIIKEL